MLQNCCNTFLVYTPHPLIFIEYFSIRTSDRVFKYKILEFHKKTLEFQWKSSKMLKVTNTIHSFFAQMYQVQRNMRATHHHSFQNVMSPLVAQNEPLEIFS